MTQKTIVLGEEFDDELRTDLIEVLRNIGATATQREWAVAGSQELERMAVTLRGNVNVIEAETYIGLSITGHESDLAEIANLIAQRRRSRSGD
jgi:hypothetical protein